MEQRHWAGVAGGLLAVLVIGIGSDPDGAGWGVALGVGVLIALALMGWYLWDTRQLLEEALSGASAREQQGSRPDQEPAEGAWAGAELHLWLRGVRREAGREESTYRLFNAGDGYALNALLHPMHAGWDPRLLHQVFDVTEDDTGGVERWMRMTAGASFRSPLVPAGKAVDLQVAGPTVEGTAFCVRWDDPQAHQRRWRCWLMAKLPGTDTGGPERRELRSLTAPLPGSCDRCPEKIGETCPHALARSAPERMAGVATSLYGYEDWLEEG